MSSLWQLSALIAPSHSHVLLLSAFSTSEIVYTLAIVPRMLSSLVGLSQPISLAGCATQMFFLSLRLPTTAFCSQQWDMTTTQPSHPLRYMVIMNKRVYAQLVWGTCSTGLLVPIVQMSSVFRLPSCDTEIAHYFCDIRLVMKLYCADTTLHDIINSVISSLVIVMPMGLVLISYILIISTNLKIASAEGQKKAFVTCTSLSSSFTMAVHPLPTLNPSQRTPWIRTSWLQ